MNLLLHLTPPAYDAWKAGFDADTEKRMNAGLTLLQLWRDADSGGVTALFEVNDRAKAEAWLEVENATGPALAARFMRRA
ncbi:DUF3303 family protein [Jannaschia sp. W003]|uniref:DUF3303 family protein n=1 Tax=Jannaschia sp. W003 TaxID=2867012 RepID=UPI0021A6A8C5|nr:DUF3303 family protein [Jannaschia sp. W003]UWQ21700.1 hypothetical protein K3554_01320 [Jannaschia sp. W003]